MIKPDELKMMRMAVVQDPYGPGPTFKGGVPDWLPEKRFFSILMDWERRGWWEYGVSPRAGWLTVDGHATITAILSNESETL